MSLATLGACYLSGGIPLALRFGDKLGLCFGGIETWRERYVTPGQKQLQAVGALRTIGSRLISLQERLGYTFKNPTLLLQAVTHPSFPGIDVRELVLKM